MNTVEAAKEIRCIIDGAFADVDFRPPPPARRQPKISRGEIAERVIRPVDRDASASWSLFIEYVDSGGNVSERRITILRFENRVGGMPAIAALCHECGEHRLFRLDRIRQIVDIATGEILDPVSHLAHLRTAGLPRVDRGMHSFCRVLAFIARCDGEFHRSEHDAIEHALTRYAMRFDGETEDVENTLAAIKNMTPDTTDLNNALIAILRSPSNARQTVAGLLLRCIGEVIDADGRHTIEEIAWALALRDCLTVVHS